MVVVDLSQCPLSRRQVNLITHWSIKYYRHNSFVSKIKAILPHFNSKIAPSRLSDKLLDSYEWLIIGVWYPVARRKFGRITSLLSAANPGIPYNAMNMNLSLYETRVIGCLIEKAITTPDQYPLSLNALVNACNQKSNRDPVLGLNEATVQETVDGLLKKFLVSRGYGNRVTKYQHRFCNSELGTLQLSEKATGIICELFLRGRKRQGNCGAAPNGCANSTMWTKSKPSLPA